MVAGPEAAFTVSSVRVNEPYIAITFDDGPHGTLTPKLLDILKERKIRATFFLIGKNAAEYPAIVKRIAAEGHELANHSWSHPNLGSLPDDAVRAEIGRTDDVIRASLGKPITLMRPPYGSLKVDQRRWVNEKWGYKIILWDVDPLDWRRPGAALVSDRILKGTKAGSIILAHDIHPGTIEAMPGTLDALLARGFQFVTVSELLEKALPPAPGKGSKPAATAGPAGTRAAATPAGPPTPFPYDAVLRANPELTPEQAARLPRPTPTPSPTPRKR